MRATDAAGDIRLQRRFEGIVAAESAQANSRGAKYVILLGAIILMAIHGWPAGVFLLLAVYMVSDFTFTRHVGYRKRIGGITTAHIRWLLVHHLMNMALFSAFAVAHAFMNDPAAHRVAAILLFSQALHTIGIETRSAAMTRISMVLLAIAAQAVVLGVMGPADPTGDRIFLHLATMLATLFFIHVTRGTMEARLSLEDRTMELAHVQKGEIVGRLTSGVAHDFNNLLTVIRGNVDLMREVPAGEADRLLDEVGDATDRGTRLISQLLQTSRRGGPEAEELDIGEFLRQFGTFARRVLPANITFQMALRGPQLSLVVDVAQLEAALLNLLVNARDALKSGGMITIRSEMAERDGATFLRLAVIDDGPGMPKDILARATDPYVTTKPRGEGSGLGLAMVAAFAQQTGGTLRLDSTPGKGTEAVLWLPL
ncbi:MAG: ATP-binding protein [Pseudomonadota bacterium]